MSELKLCNTILIVNLIFTLSLKAIPNSESSANVGSISGIITNQETGQPLPDANVFIEGTPFGTASQDGGFYTINQLPFGTYTLRVEVIGYQPFSKSNIQVEGHSFLDVSITPSPIPMNPIIKTASRSDHLQNHISESCEVLSQIHFSECNGNTAGEIVEQKCGIYVKNYGGFAGIKSIAIRGSESSHVLVLLDGLKLNSSQDGSVDINTIPIEVLERIEIIRGGHSALLGTDAMGGAINLITHESLDSKPSTYQIKTTTGSFGTFGWSLQSTHTLEFASLFISYNQLKSDGDYKYIDAITRKKEKRMNNDLSQNNLFAKIKMHPFQNADLSLIYQLLNSERGVAGATTYLSPQARREEDKQMVGFHYEQQLSQKIRVESRGYFHHSENGYQDPGGWIPTDDRHKVKATGGDIFANWHINSEISCQIGTEFRYDKIESTQISDRDRNMMSAFLRAEWNVLGLQKKDSPIFKLIPAVRFDSYSDINTQFSPKLGFIYKKSKESNTIFRGNVSTAFRAPTFNDLFWPEDLFSKGNPELKPEISFNCDLGFAFQNLLSELFQWESTLFYNKIQDLIQWQPDLDYKWMPTNVGTAEIMGLENSCTFREPENKFYFKITHTWMHAKDITPNTPNKVRTLIFRPKNKFDFQTGFKFQSASINLTYSFVDRQFRDIGNSDICPASHLINGNIGIAQKIKDMQLEMRFQIFNVLNKNIEIFNGYPLSGREFRFTTAIKY